MKPSAPVTLVPLDQSPGADGTSSTTGPASKARPDRPDPDGSGNGDGTDSRSGSRTGSGDGGEGSVAGGGTGTGAPAAPGGTASTGTGTGSPAPPGTPATPPTPAALTWDDPARESTDKRWCEKVTVTFHNTGGTAVRSGTVTFGTHVIGALGIDWATVKSTVDLPAPLGPKADKDHTWTVCVDSWRVPLGMHIETQDVSVTWK
ncbi:hypothetical protein [Streptomyces sp. NPDC006012]|uniref:hypothetical protein n=1 Tax=Streptomyces sp. NPDC006012 TaxID=3364739 RepID=UPI0036BB7C12